MTAHDIAASPENYNKVCVIQGHEWECMGYSNSGRTIRFSRVVVLPNNKLATKNIYVKSYKTVIVK